jgi:hypothetical protein
MSSSLISAPATPLSCIAVRTCQLEHVSQDQIDLPADELKADVHRPEADFLARDVLGVPLNRRTSPPGVTRTPTGPLAGQYGPGVARFWPQNGQKPGETA